MFSDEEKEYQNQIEMEIIKVLDTIRPFIQRDGGDIRLVKYEKGVVYIKFYGACVGCMSIDETLSDGIQAILMDEVPEVEKVVNVDAMSEEELNENNIEEF